jgi:hypothetical protein
MQSKPFSLDHSILKQDKEGFNEKSMRASNMVERIGDLPAI